MKSILPEVILSHEKQLWQEAIFVFDSSALLNFYEYSEKTRRQIYDTTFKKLEKRLWLTNQTEYEYLKNRSRVLLKPQKMYDDLISTYFDGKQFDIFKNQFDQLKNRTKKDDKHPFIDISFFSSFEQDLKDFQEKLSAFRELLIKEIELRKQEIDSISENDTIQTAIEFFFQVTKGCSFGELIEIAKEGEFRYKNSIPPGYEDLKRKIGLSVYGDLIIWKQLLKLASESGKPVLLVIDDLKIDWCYQNSKDKNIIDAPREELLKEFQDTTGKKFWSYSSTQFLMKAKEFLAASITEDTIADVNRSNQFTISELIERSVYKWAKTHWSNIGQLAGDEQGKVDLVLTVDSIQIGIEIKYFSNSRTQSIKSLVDRVYPRFLSRGLFERFEEVFIIIVCQDENHAKWMLDNHKLEFDRTTYERLEVFLGFMNDLQEFQLLNTPSDLTHL